jgi:hypothetical protein
MCLGKTREKLKKKKVSRQNKRDKRIQAFFDNIQEQSDESEENGNFTAISTQLTRSVCEGEFFKEILSE